MAESKKYYNEIKNTFDDVTTIFFSCNLCHEEYNSKEDMIQHIERVHFKKVSCDVCKENIRLVDLKEHMALNHYKTDLNIEKEIEGKSTAVWNIETGKTVGYNCNECNKKSVTALEMKVHIDNDHKATTNKDESEMERTMEDFTCQSIIYYFG